MVLIYQHNALHMRIQNAQIAFIAMVCKVFIVLLSMYYIIGLIFIMSVLIVSTDLQYQIQACVGNHNTICGSCESCFFTDPAVRFRCMATTDRYVWWAMDNCCQDNEGNMVSKDLVCCFIFTYVNYK